MSQKWHMISYGKTIFILWRSQPEKSVRVVVREMFFYSFVVSHRHIEKLLQFSFRTDSRGGVKGGILIKHAVNWKWRFSGGTASNSNEITCSSLFLVRIGYWLTAWTSSSPQRQEQTRSNSTHSNNPCTYVAVIKMKSRNLMGACLSGFGSVELINQVIVWRPCNDLINFEGFWF